jgi:hypothetical protein
MTEVFVGGQLRDDDRCTPYDVKVAACADYLIGRPMSVITHKHGVCSVSVIAWVKACGCFKLRREGNY